MYKPKGVQGPLPYTTRNELISHGSNSDVSLLKSVSPHMAYPSARNHFLCTPRYHGFLLGRDHHAMPQPFRDNVGREPLHAIRRALCPHGVEERGLARVGG